MFGYLNSTKKYIYCMVINREKQNSGTAAKLNLLVSTIWTYTIKILQRDRSKTDNNTLTYTEKLVRLPCLTAICGNEACADGSCLRHFSLRLSESVAVVLAGCLQFTWHTQAHCWYFSAFLRQVLHLQMWRPVWYKCGAGAWPLLPFSFTF